MNWKQLAEKISALSEEQQQQQVFAVVLGDVISAPFMNLEVAPDSPNLMEGLTPGQPFLSED